MTWGPNHLWKAIVQTLPRSTRWWYSVVRDSEVVRVENLEIPREYDFDLKDRYFQIVDRWNDYVTTVTPIVRAAD